jgi:hypothetical protein
MRPPMFPCPSGVMLGPYGGLGTSLAMIDTSVVHWWLPGGQQWYMNGVQWCTMNVYEMVWVVCLHMPRLLWMALKVKWTQETQICCCAKWFWWQKSKWQKCSIHHRDAFISFPLGLWVIEHVWVTEIANNDMSKNGYNQPYQAKVVKKLQSHITKVQKPQHLGFPRGPPPWY